MKHTARERGMDNRRKRVERESGRMGRKSRRTGVKWNKIWRKKFKVGKRRQEGKRWVWKRVKGSKQNE